MGYMFVALLCVLAPALGVHIQKEVPRIQCALPPLPKGVVYKSNNEGNLLFYRCHRGLKTLGEVFSRCEDGMWSSPPPICIANGCRMVYHVTNGRVTIGYGGAMITVACIKGYKMHGKSVIVCDGKEWNSTAPTCTDVADRGGSIAYSHRHTSKSHSDWLLESDYSCIKRKGSVRPPRIEHALSNTQWAVLEGKPRLYTAYRCQWGYVSKGQANNMYCKNGEWVGGLPKCTGAVTTSPPTIPRDQADPAKMKHVDWLMLSDYTCMGTSTAPQKLTPKPTTNGHYALRYDVIDGMPRLYAELRCDHGYTLRDNQSNVYCKNRAWFGPEPRCVQGKSDNDACADNNGGCAHVCRNSRDSYSCHCYDGFQLTNDGHSCKPTGSSRPRGIVAPMALFHH